MNGMTEEPQGREEGFRPHGALNEPRLRCGEPSDSRDVEGADLRSFVFDTVLESMRTSIYVTDLETDEIL